MAFDKKISTVFIITSIVIAGTALAAVLTTNTTTKTLLFGGEPIVSTTTSTTSLGDVKPAKTEVTVTSREDAGLASVIMRILGLQVSVEEISSLKSRNIGNGEITLAYNLAHASGKSVQEILDMRYEQKMGWGKIANTLGVKLHDAEDRSVTILREAQLGDDAEKLKINIHIDDEDEDKEHHINNADKHNNHKPEKMDDNKKPKKQGVGHRE